MPAAEQSALAVINWVFEEQRMRAMSGPRFFQTIMGRTYYERTLPALVDELAKLNRNLEKLILKLGKDDGKEQA